MEFTSLNLAWTIQNLKIQDVILYAVQGDFSWATLPCRWRD